jgi:AcrR family transcriptional regulator
VNTSAALSPPEPRRRDAPATRARILSAAQRAFSTLGYSRAGLREISLLADTSTTLLIRYFGSKAGLFEAALTEAFTAGDPWSIPRADFGAQLAAQFLRADVAILPPAMVALAAGDAEAAAITARVAQTHAIAPLARWLGGANAQARAAQIFMLTTSFVLYSRQVPIVPLEQGIDPALVHWLASSIQQVVDSPPPIDQTPPAGKLPPKA